MNGAERARAFLTSDISDLPAYRDHAAYLDDLLDSRHHQTVNRHWERGTKGRRFRDQDYFSDVLHRMARQAKADRHAEVAEQLQNLRQEIFKGMIAPPD